MTDSAVTDFPEPDSPTSASVSPLRMSKETRSTASASRSPRPKATERSRTERRGEPEGFICVGLLVMHGYRKAPLPHRHARFSPWQPMAIASFEQSLLSQALSQFGPSDVLASRRASRLAGVRRGSGS